MRFLYFLILIFIVSGPLYCYADKLPEEIDVEIFSGETVNKLDFTVTHGRYLVCDIEHNKLLELTPFSTITFERKGNEFLIIRNDTTLFSVDKITLQGAAFHNSFFVNPSHDDLHIRGYDGNLTLMIKNGSFSMINRTPFESYVAGTVQWESGFNKHDIFYQVQAIIIRTYALRNLNRHAHEGFHLCDKVHCQAYYGKSTDKSIITAVDKCRGEVLTDLNGNLLNTVYHANCGGHTLNSENLWAEALPYLRATKDEYCSEMPGARWETSISSDELRKFLQQRFHYNPGEDEWKGITGYRQSSRKQFLDDKGLIPLRHIREHFGLRSTFFTISLDEDGETLHLEGKGYGHGVGLCQEGAMQRAKLGYSRNEILKFYYRNSTLKYLETDITW
ncbi:MAG: SpoIID/LytB domain-containing protein [Bacteroidales bacterium]